MVSDKYQRLFFEDSQMPPQIWENLPPAIEELRVEIEPESRLLLKAMQMSNLAKELEMWLNKIAEHKGSRYPNLRKVVVWQARLSRDCQTLLTKKLHSSPGLLKHFRENKIGMFFSRDREPSALDRIELA